MNPDQYDLSLRAPYGLAVVWAEGLVGVLAEVCHVAALDMGDSSVLVTEPTATCTTAE